MKSGIEKVKVVDIDATGSVYPISSLMILLYCGLEGKNCKVGEVEVRILLQYIKNL